MTNATKNLNVKKSMKSVLECVMSLNAVCKQINSCLNESFEYDGVKYTVKEWFDALGVKTGKNGLTVNTLKGVWNKDMMLDGGKFAMWRRVVAKCGDKVVYEWDAKNKKHIAVADYQLVECTKWTASMVLRGIIDSVNYADVEKRIAKADAHLKEITIFFITKSQTASRQNSRTTLVECNKESIVAGTTKLFPKNASAK